MAPRRAAIGPALALLAVCLCAPAAEVHGQPLDLQSPPLDRQSPREIGTIAPASLEGWSTFQIKKTDAELIETARLASDPESAARTGPGDVTLPPQYDTLRLWTGIGYLQGADWAGDISGAGKINGRQTDVSAFLTAGPQGLRVGSAHASIFAPDGTWRAEGGDLYSDLRGRPRGGRVSWFVGQKWTPSLSFYLHRQDQFASGPTVVAYRDRIQLLPQVRVGGELTSDGAAFLQGQYRQGRLDLNMFYRVAKSPTAGHDTGVAVGLHAGRGVLFSGAFRRSDAIGDSSQWQLASVRAPLTKHAAVTLERSWWTGASHDGAINALTVQLRVGPVQLFQRVQWGRTDYRQRAVPFGFDLRQSQSTASYTPGPWGTVNYQESTQWFDDGSVQQWDEVSSTLQVGRRTSAQFVMAFPHVSDPQRFRVRVTERLSDTLLIDVQYGRLSAFQMTRAADNEQSRVLVTIRRMWQVRSPSRGGDVRGRATDQRGAAVAGALVRLGPYSTVTDRAGDYRFTRVPEGQFTLALDRNKLPVRYAWDEQPQAVAVTSRSAVNADLHVTPLNTIRGHVYQDRNGNGAFDESEGILNAVVSMDDAVTATNATGAYAFYNHPPGHYTVRLDRTRLARGLAPASPVEMNVAVTGDAPLAGVDFTVEAIDMPIIMRTIGG